jgi:hypothetical protein
MPQKLAEENQKNGAAGNKNTFPAPGRETDSGMITAGITVYNQPGRLIAEITEIETFLA